MRFIKYVSTSTFFMFECFDRKLGLIGSAEFCYSCEVDWDSAENRSHLWIFMISIPFSEFSWFAVSECFWWMWLWRPYCLWEEDDEAGASEVPTTLSWYENSTKQHEKWIRKKLYQLWSDPCAQVLRARLSLLELCFFDVFQAFLRVDVRWKRYDIWRDQEDGWAYLVSISSADTGTAYVHLVRRLEQANLRAQEPILGGQFGNAARPHCVKFASFFSMCLKQYVWSQVFLDFLMFEKMRTYVYIIHMYIYLYICIIYIYI